MRPLLLDELDDRRDRLVQARVRGVAGPVARDRGRVNDMAVRGDVLGDGQHQLAGVPSSVNEDICGHVAPLSQSLRLDLET